MEVDKYLDILKTYWGYPDFRGIQREIIESIGEGKDTLGLMPTGGGKSITFQVPALAMKGVCIVITPLIALMKDQVDALRKKNIKAYAIYGSMHREEILTVLDNAVLGGVSLLYVSPERLSSELFQTKLRHMQVSFITVDEAHCISQWGYDFRPSYLAISQIRKIKPQAPILALTATATPATIDDIQKQLAFKENNVFRMSFERKNLAYIVRTTDDKLCEAIHILNSVEGSSIIYTHNREKTKEMARMLNEQGIAATFYHAGLDPTVRDDHQMLWQEGKVKVIVATNAFGMGIDKADVRTVIHVDCPDSIEAYFQEAGRAGRDGKKAYAVLLRNDEKDRNVLEQRVKNTFPDKDYIKEVYEHVAYFLQIGVGSGYGYTFEFKIEQFCQYFKHFPIRLKSALKILQMSGYLEYDEDDDMPSRMRFLLDRDELYRVRELSDNENNVIIATLRCYCGLFADYVFISQKVISREAGVDENEVYQILKRLTKRHIISFIPGKKVPHVKYLQNRVTTDELYIPRNVYEQRKKLFETRIQAMAQYIENDGMCRSRQLLSYFGEMKKDNCNQCDVCIANNRNTKQQAQQREEIRRKIIDLLDDGEEHPASELAHFNDANGVFESVIMEMMSNEEVVNCNGKLALVK